jgi:hypothetical protein
MEILIVCGINQYTKYHEKIIGIINNINKPTMINSSMCTFTTLQNIDYLHSTPADIYMSSFSNNFCIFNKSHKQYLAGERNPQIKKFNDDHDGKFDYIILEHCPVLTSPEMIPQFIKHYNLLKQNGYLILFFDGDLNHEFKFTKHTDFPILDYIFNRRGNNIYLKQNNDMYNMVDHLKNYYKYCLNYNPATNYIKLYDSTKTDASVGASTAASSNKDEKKYLKYKYKYLNLQKKLF